MKQEIVKVFKLYNHYKENDVNPIWIAVIALSSVLAVMWKMTARSMPVADSVEMCNDRRRYLNIIERKQRDELLEEHN